MEQFLPVNEVLCYQGDGVDDPSLGMSGQYAEKNIPGRKLVDVNVLNAMYPALDYQSVKT